ncbi:MAG TPA: N-acetylmuramoyl-L-alanine amidase [Gaiellaceae bacterium]|nr:N-acetylmuramoyl-L-alanine amidase [Gaiellaceae bacterium]
MTLRRTLALAALVVASAPGAALGADVRMVALEVPVERSSGAEGALPARPAPLAFDMVGLHWRGPGEVSFRTARDPGVWSAWKPARPEGEDLPDSASGEGGATAGWKLGNPYWTGRARWIQYRLAGRVTRLRAFFLTAAAAAAPPPAARAATATARPARPAIVRRAQWNADESIVRDAPSYAERLRLAVVHHTAGTNSYTKAQSAGIVRGIQRYHVVANGLDDIGYNFLVDRYGQIFEGRAGGTDRNVIGAHAKGFNTGSVGVAVLGTYGSTTVSSAGRAAVERLLAWRLDVAHVDPVSALTAISYGNERYEAGTAVRLRAISGHRDTGYTTCPGTKLYGQLGAIARTAATIGLPKLYAPKASGGLGGPVRFTARLSGSRPWLVTVRDGSGATVAEGGGSGTAVDWTWDSSSAPLDRYTYVISSGAEVRPARGVVPGPPPLAVTNVRVSPSVLTPNGDGVSERTRVSFTVTARATVGVSVRAAGSPVRTLLARKERPPGRFSVTWDGTAGGAPVAEGRYAVRITAARGSETRTVSRALVVDRSLGWLTLSREALSPNGDRRGKAIAFGFELTRSADVRVRVYRGDRRVATLVRAGLPAGMHAGTWNGLLDGDAVADGVYTLRVHATTSLGTRSLDRRFAVDTLRPVVRIRSARLVGGGTRVRIALSEAARVRVWYGTGDWRDGSMVTVDRPAGRSRVWRRAAAGIVRVVARDAAGNRSRAALADVAAG